MENSNIPKRQAYFPIPDKVFRDAWILANKSVLEIHFNTHLGDCYMADCDPLTYRVFCNLMYTNGSELFDNRDN